MNHDASPCIVCGNVDTDRDVSAHESVCSDKCYRNWTSIEPHIRAAILRDAAKPNFYPGNYGYVFESAMSMLACGLLARDKSRTTTFLSLTDAGRRVLAWLESDEVREGRYAAE